jgi:hypothetical protein
MNILPQKISRIGVPPVKCQGIKTKLAPSIFNSIQTAIPFYCVFEKPALYFASPN